MTASRATEIGTILLGLYLIAGGIRSLGAVPGRVLEYDVESAAYIIPGNYLLYLGLALSVSLTVGIGPGVLLILFRRRIANLFFRSAEPASMKEVSPSYVVGCKLLSYYVVIFGVVGFASSVTMTLFISASPTSMPSLNSLVLGKSLPMLASSVVQVSLGVLLYRHARNRAALDVPDGGDPSTLNPPQSQTP